MRQSAITIRDLSFRYGKTRVLENIDLEVADKSFLALIGPNGGGKTTLLKLMSGLLKPSNGSVKVHGGSPESMYAKIGYVPQDTNMNSDFPITALEIVLMGHECEKRPLFGYGRHEVHCAEKALEHVNMLEYKDSRIGDLSGGQRQRVLIARALCAHNTEILFLDEPTSSLDVTGQQQIYELLKQLNAQMTIVVVSHDLEVILDYASQVGYINHSLTLHDAPGITRESILCKLGISDGHLCEVEILSAMGQKHE